MKPLSALEDASSIRTVVSDVDDTITSSGRLLPAALDAMYRLRASSRSLVLLTGGSAGWSDVYIRQWPVDKVIAESGALMLSRDESGAVVYTRNPVISADVSEKRRLLLEKIGYGRLSSDQYARLYDIAVDLSRCTEEELEDIRKMAEDAGASTSRSSIHLNIWFGGYDKAEGLRTFFGSDLSGCAYIGDSLPDAALFSIFPLSFGVASVQKHRADFPVLPSYVASRPGGEGFAEIIDRICG